MTSNTRFRILFPVLALTVATAACGGSSEPASSSTTSSSSTSQPAAPAAAPAPAPAEEEVHDGRAVEITANDEMKFGITEIRATAGERLSVTLSNTGTMPKFSMGHNWVLLAEGTDPEAFVAEAASAATTDYVPPARQGDILAATNLLGPNEQDTVTFAAPTTPGEYIFLCSFPGHFQVGMRGVLIVE